MANEYNRPISIFDIETRPENKLVKQNTKPFDRSSVKVGNLKDAEKIAAKIDAAEEAYWKAAYDKAALSPFTASICAIGIHHEDAENPLILLGEERDILEAFWNEFRKNDECKWSFFTGSNNKAVFDIAFIYHRSKALNITEAGGVINDEGRFNRCFVDMAQKSLAGLDFPTFKSVDSIAAFYGLVGEDVGFQTVKSKAELLEVHGIEGKNFWEFIDSDKPEDQAAALIYLNNDLALERAISNRIN